ncbi:MAG: hypothetical protein QY303_11915 [Vicingaceae bacterium]|nr:MAG: hypothetical protein QY303_11915 [Vicingaceae bacterium]
MKIEPVNTQIIKYIKENKVFTLATSFQNIPYSAICFYAYHMSENYFVFTSDKRTKHVSDFLIQPFVAGSIYKKQNTIASVKGLQFTGKIILDLSTAEKENIEQLYHGVFPFTKKMKLSLWMLKPLYFKLTDNSLGFGKKIKWNSLDLNHPPPLK